MNKEAKRGKPEKTKSNKKSSDKKKAKITK